MPPSPTRLLFRELGRLSLVPGPLVGCGRLSLILGPSVAHLRSSVLRPYVTGLQHTLASCRCKSYPLQILSYPSSDLRHRRSSCHSPPSYNASCPHPNCANNRPLGNPLSHIRKQHPTVPFTAAELSALGLGQCLHCRWAVADLGAANSMHRSKLPTSDRSAHKGRVVGVLWCQSATSAVTGMLESRSGGERWPSTLLTGELFIIATLSSQLYHRNGSAAEIIHVCGRIGCARRGVQSRCLDSV